MSIAQQGLSLAGFALRDMHPDRSRMDLDCILDHVSGVRERGRLAAGASGQWRDPGAVADRQRTDAPASRRQGLTKRYAFSMGLMCCKPESHVHAVARVIKCSSGGSCRGQPDGRCFEDGPSCRRRARGRCRCSRLRSDELAAEGRSALTTGFRCLTIVRITSVEEK